MTSVQSDLSTSETHYILDTGDNNGAIPDYIAATLGLHPASPDAPVTPNITAPNTSTSERDIRKSSKTEKQVSNQIEIPEFHAPSDQSRIIIKTKRRNPIASKLPSLLIGMLLGLAISIAIQHAKKPKILEPKVAWKPFNSIMIPEPQPEDIKAHLEIAKDPESYRVNTVSGWVNIEPLYTAGQIPERLMMQYNKLLLKMNKAKMDYKKITEVYPLTIKEKEELEKKMKERIYKPDEEFLSKLIRKGRQKLSKVQALEKRAEEKWCGDTLYYPLYNTSTNRWSLGVAEVDAKLQSVRFRIFSTAGPKADISKEKELVLKAFTNHIKKDILRLQNELLEIPEDRKRLDVINKLVNLKPIYHPQGQAEEESVEVNNTDSGVFVCLMARDFTAGRPFTLNEEFKGKERLMIAADFINESQPDDLSELFDADDIKIIK